MAVRGPRWVPNQMAFILACRQLCQAVRNSWLRPNRLAWDADQNLALSWGPSHQDILLYFYKTEINTEHKLDFLSSPCCPSFDNSISVTHCWLCFYPLHHLFSSHEIETSKRDFGNIQALPLLWNTSLKKSKNQAHILTRACMNTHPMQIHTGNNPATRIRDLWCRMTMISGTLER